MSCAALALVLVLLAANTSAEAGTPADWPAAANESCHAPTPSGHTLNVDNATHAVCAAACAAMGCGCFDLAATGSCKGTSRYWGFRRSRDRTAYTNASSPAPSPTPPAPKGAISLHPMLGSNMVLQRGPARAALFGWGQAVGTVVTVHFRDQAYTGSVAPNSSSLGGLMWRVELPPTPASVVPETIAVTAAGTTLTLAGVRFGDVWACGGQSNMGVTLNETFEWFHPDVAKDIDYPIHLLKFPHVPGVDDPTIHVGRGGRHDYPPRGYDDPLPWRNSTHSHLTVFSAVCYYFGHL